MNPKNFNYPIPDPAWDYAGIWHQCWQAKQQLEAAIKYMSDIEEAKPESDRHLKDQLETLQTQIEGALAFLKKS